MAKSLCILVLASIFQIGCGFPIAGLPLDYSPSSTYIYKYETEVAFNEPNITKTSQAKKDVGFKLTSDVRLIPVWSKSNKLLVKLTLSNTKLQSTSHSDHSATVKSLQQYPLLFDWEGTLISEVYISEKEPSWAANVKIAIASLLQLQKENGHRHEVDISGKCTVTYKVDGNKITKSKAGCVNVDTSADFNNINPVLDVSTYSTSETRYELKENVIQTVSSLESHSSQLNMRDHVAAAVLTKQHLVLQSSESGASKVQASTIKEAVQVISTREKLNLYGSQLVSIFETKQCSKGKCSATCTCKLATTVSDERDNLDPSNAASITAGSAVLRLVEAFRKASKADILAVLKDDKNSDIVPALIDVTTAAQTAATQEALMEFLDFTDTYDITLPERYLLAAAFSTHPSQKLLQDLLDMYKRDIPDERVRESIAEALGAIVYTYSRQGKQAKDKIVDEVQAAMFAKLESCPDSACTSVQLRALSNAGLSDSLPILLKYAETAQVATISEAAIKALRKLDQALFDDKVKDVMKRIFHQKNRGFDSAVRTQALKVLLDNGPTDAEIQDILVETSDPDNQELDLYILARLDTEAQRNPTLREQIRKAFKSEESLRNWNLLSPRGQSLAFKSNLADTMDLDATYDMYTENSKAHIMKRSGMDVDIISPSQTLPLYTFGIFAAGLEGLLGEEVEPGQEDVEATAGIELNLIDVSLRPVTFFTGQSALMSAVWNAPSEFMSALQTNILLHDRSQRLPLQNGFVVEHLVQGVVSMDLSGLCSISLWNKNCHTHIKNSGSLVIHSQFGIQTPVVKAGMEYRAETSSVIDFVTDVDFYDKIKMCLQMSRPDFVFRHTVHKYDGISGFKKSYLARTSRTTKMPSVSYPLPKFNNDQCRVLLADQS